MSSHGAEYDRRDAMLQALRAGRLRADINEFLWAPRNTAYQISQRVREQQIVDDPQDQ